jgi:hypothetical protein
MMQTSRVANSTSTWLRVMLLTVAVCGGAQTLGAQAQISIREPSEWDEGRPVVAPAGRPIRIRGIAFHPGGVRQILVNGAPARIEAAGSVWNFEQTITAENQPRTITIAIVPTTGERFESKFTVQPPQGTGPVPVASVSHSSGFKKRGWVYGLGAIGGGVLAAMTTSSTAEVCQTTNGLQDCVNRTTTEASYRGAGIGIAAASVVVGLIDYTLSSRSRRVASAGSDSDARATIQLSATPAKADGRWTLGLLRLRF